MMKATVVKILIICIILLCVFCNMNLLNSKGKIPQDYFISPVTIPITLAGKFAEVRTNHFHAGIDIRTAKKTGLPIIAVADGYVSRIRIMSYGYGKVIYIRHRNGFTSVYAHLLQFKGVIATYTRIAQYLQESFEIDVIPTEGLLAVKKGDTIAYSGNSGSSNGPHLHFEMRHTKSNWVVNPLLFGFGIYDKSPPVIKWIKFYPIGNNSAFKVVFKGRKTTYSKIYHEPFELMVRQYNGKFYLKNVKEISAKGKISFAIETSDKMHGSSFTLGVYNHQLIHNGETIFNQKLRAFSREDSRYVNSHIDYFDKISKKRALQKLFLMPNNQMPFYKDLINNGIVNLDEADYHKFRVHVSDYFHNEANLEFTVKNLDEDISEPAIVEPKYTKLFYFDKPNYYKDPSIEISFEPYSFYDNLYFHYSRKAGRAGLYSPLHFVHSWNVPVHKNYTLKIRPLKLPKHLQDKAIIASYDGNEKYSAVGGEWDNGYISASVRYLGTYTIIIDSVAPIIKALNFKQNSDLTNINKLRVLITDDISGIKSYRATIDDKWILMEYDAKYNLLTYKFYENPNGKTHHYHLVVLDKKNNKTEININFIR